MMDYAEFLERKRIKVPACGFEPGEISAPLFDWQRDIVRWAVRRGRAAIFASYGLGKTLMSLEWASQVCRQTGGNILILAPLAVAQQTRKEGEKFGYQVTLCRTQADVRPGINVSNYEMLDHFNPQSFAGAVFDESAVIKAYMGVLRRKLLSAFASTPYKLNCTALPAPNDHMEIGNQCEHLGIMPSNEMLSRWFINDTMAMGSYRLKGHAEKDFYDWMASWAVSLRRPSDLGYSDDGFILPPLNWIEERVKVDRLEGREDKLWRDPELNATSLHKEMRLTAPARAARVAELVNNSDKIWSVWCNTNYEADELKRLIPKAVEVRGSDSIEYKEHAVSWFCGYSEDPPCRGSQNIEKTGRERRRILISKPTIFGFGLNFQHCHNIIFVGLSYSFEQLHQAVHRFYRFGQKESVNVYLVLAETEGNILSAVKEKMSAYEKMMDNMRLSSSKLTLGNDKKLVAYNPTIIMKLPEWLREVKI